MEPDLVETLPSDVQARQRTHEQFASSRRQFYVAPPDLFSELDATADALSRDDGLPANVLIVSGPRGCGKSALVASWVHQWKAAHPGCFTIEHYIGAAQSQGDHLELIRHVIDEIFARNAIREERPATASALERGLRRWLATARDEPLVLVVDAVDQLDEAGRSLSWLPADIPSHVRLIISAADGPMLDRLLERAWRELVVPPLSRRDRLSILRRQVEHHGHQLPRTLAQSITSARHSANPLFLRTSLDEVREMRRRGDAAERIDFFLGATGVDELFQRVLERVEVQHGVKLVRDVLALLWVSRAGVSEEEIAGALGIEGDTVREVLRSAEVHLRTVDGRRMFSHDLMRESVGLRYLSGRGAASRERRLRRRLVAHLKSASVERRAVELPWQLERLGDGEGMLELLRDAEFRLLLCDRSRLLDTLLFWSTLENQLPDWARSVSEAVDRIVLDLVDSERLFTVNHMAGMLLWRGAAREARDLIRRHVENAPDAPRATVAMALQKLCATEIVLGCYGEAELTADRALSLLRPYSDHAELVTKLMTAKADIELRSEKAYVAIQTLDEALLLARKHSGCDRNVPQMLSLRAMLLDVTCRPYEALDSYRDAVSEAERIWGSSNPATLECRYLFGAALLEVNQVGLAREHLEVAVRLGRQVGCSQYVLARYEIGYGAALSHYEPQAAREFLDSGLTRMEGLLGSTDKQLYKAYRYIVGVYSRAGCLPAARTRLETAASEAVAHHGRTPTSSFPRLYLAHCMTVQGEFHSALSILREDLPIYLERRTKFTPGFAAVLAECCQRISSQGLLAGDDEIWRAVDHLSQTEDVEPGHVP